MERLPDIQLTCIWKKLEMIKYCSAFCLLLCALFLFSGCALVDHFRTPEPDTAQDIMEDGEEAFEQGDYQEAISRFRQLKEDFPFSPYTTRAELRLADAYFADEQYEAAKLAYKDFESLHPGHEKIPHALLRIGKSNLRQFRAIDLPQDNVREARQFFNRVQQSYPQTEYAQEAREYADKCARHLANHEIFVANFYWRTSDYQAAWKRYAGVADNFSELEEIYEYASERSDLAYYRYQQQQAEDIRTEEKGTWRNWFDWL